jgi:uncharacterized coiled-coil protein SlyX
MKEIIVETNRRLEKLEKEIDAINIKIACNQKIIEEINSKIYENKN